MNSKLSKSLLGLRLSVFLVMFMWTLDKFLNPVHTAKVFGHFYLIKGLTENASYIVGALQLILIIGFLIGFKKKFTYGGVFILHLISTLSSYSNYFHPYEKVNLLFFAAWPMLAACWALFALRDDDKLFSLD